MKHNWTQEEIDYLVNNYGEVSTKQMAEVLKRDYQTTKKAVKKYLFDIQEKSLPDGFVTIPSSSIHAINRFGTVIRIKTRKEIKPSINKRGYFQVCLQDKKSYRVHRLVAELFVENPNNKPHVNHKDGNKLNNSYLNLEWVTNLENRHHAMKTGLRDNVSKKISIKQTGGSNSCARLSEKDVFQIYDMLLDGKGTVAISKHFGVQPTTISAIKTGRSWKHLYHYYLEPSTTRSEDRTSQAIGDGNGEYPLLNLSEAKDKDIV